MQVRPNVCANVCPIVCTKVCRIVFYKVSRSHWYNVGVDLRVNPINDNDESGGWKD